MKIRLGFLLVLLVGLFGVDADEARTNHSPTVLLVLGAPGTDEYDKAFQQWADQWRQAAQQGQFVLRMVGLTPTQALPDREQLKHLLADEPKVSSNVLWLVLLGHGTFDGQEAKFNLRGPDLTATELSGWLQSFERPLAIVNCASASAPFLNKLSAPGRVIITSTRSGYELNYSRFGQFFSAAITDPQADLDKDGQTSLIEAFLMASRRVAEFYETEGRLATEHALLDDNGDGLGTPADWFRGVRATKLAQDGASLDGFRAHQFHLILSPEERQLSPMLRAQRDQLELAVAQLREKKGSLNEEEYYRQLETILLELARISLAEP